MSEQFGFEQRLAQRRAVDLDEGLVAPLGQRMERASEDLLAGAALAAQQDGRVGARHLADLADHALDGGGGADHPLERLGRRLDGRARGRLGRDPDRLARLLHDPVAVAGDETAEADRLFEHRRHHVQDAQVGVEVARAIVLEAAVGAEHAQHEGRIGLIADRHRHQRLPAVAEARRQRLGAELLEDVAGNERHAVAEDMPRHLRGDRAGLGPGGRHARGGGRDHIGIDVAGIALGLGLRPLLQEGERAVPQTHEAPSTPNTAGMQAIGSLAPVRSLAISQSASRVRYSSPRSATAPDRAADVSITRPPSNSYCQTMFAPCGASVQYG